MEGEILSRLAASLVEVPAESSPMASLTMCGGVGFIFGVYIVQRVMKKRKTNNGQLLLLFMLS
jgi:hypothetical protein